MPSSRAWTPQPVKGRRSQGTSAAGGASQRMARLASAARDSVRGAVAGAGSGGVSVSPLPPDWRSAGDVLHPDSGHSDLPADLSKPARRSLDDAGYTTLQQVSGERKRPGPPARGRPEGHRATAHGPRSRLLVLCGQTLTNFRVPAGGQDRALAGSLNTVAA